MLCINDAQSIHQGLGFVWLWGKQNLHTQTIEKWINLERNIKLWLAIK